MNPRRKQYENPILGSESVSGEFTRMALDSGNAATRFLQDQNRLVKAQYINPITTDDVLLAGVPGDILGRGTSSAVYHLILPKRTSITHEGYVVKVTTLGNDWHMQSAARTLYLPLDVKLAGRVARIDGYFESQSNELRTYQRKLPFTALEVMNGLTDQLRAGDDRPDTILSTAYLLSAITALAYHINTAGYVDRDLKPENIGVRVPVSGENSGMYQTQLIDHAELIAVDGLLAKMSTDQHNTFNRSMAANPHYSPRRTLEAYLAGDWEQLGQTSERDNAIMLGLIMANTLHDLYNGIDTKSTAGKVAASLGIRKEYRKSKPIPLNSALEPIARIAWKATDEEFVAAGGYTTAMIKRDMQAALTEIIQGQIVRLSDNPTMYTPTGKQQSSIRLSNDTLPPNATIAANGTIAVQPENGTIAVPQNTAPQGNETIGANDTIMANPRPKERKPAPSDNSTLKH